MTCYQHKYQIHRSTASIADMVDLLIGITPLKRFRKVDTGEKNAFMLSNTSTTYDWCFCVLLHVN